MGLPRRAHGFQCSSQGAGWPPGQLEGGLPRWGALAARARALDPHHRPQDPWGLPATGWSAQLRLLRAKYANVSLPSRLPLTVWRGRYNDKRYPYRDRLR